MTADRESLYWQTNEKWWRKNKDGEYEITEEAPERAKKSFELWEKS